MAQNIETLKQLFPTIVKEGQIDFAELQSLLGEEIVDKEEYYRFTWAGKSQARLEANKPSTATLRPDKESSKNWDTTKNIFIEGDNLEVLKLLQKSYANRIKMIYIDPPYNTGKDFVYKDNYTDNLQNYLDITGQTDDQGKKNSTNTESDGRYHSNWLNMMYPRLRLARNLMTDDGVIFISIDDNEVHNLRKLCDEVFGEENFVALFAVENNPKGRKNSKYVSQSNDFCIVYAKKSNDENSYFVENIPKSSKDLSLDDNGNFVHNSGKRILVGENDFNNFVNNFQSEKHYTVYYNKETNEIRFDQEKKIEDCKLLEGFDRYISFRENKFVENTYTQAKLFDLYQNKALEFRIQKFTRKIFRL